jgi:FkbH-like protein
MLNRLVPTKKILAVDLDGTLHGGVVGEDLFSFENFHRDLVKQLKEFKRFGMITVLVSKNDLTDVQVAMQKKLLDSISTEDFDYLKVGWGSKSDAISEVIDELKFGSDSVIFIDDNPAELIDFERNFPFAESRRRAVEKRAVVFFFPYRRARRIHSVLEDERKMLGNVHVDGREPETFASPVTFDRA